MPNVLKQICWLRKEICNEQKPGLDKHDGQFTFRNCVTDMEDVGDFLR